MKHIAVYGAGGLGQEVCCVIKSINSIEKRWNFIGFFDDGKKKGDEILHFGSVLGGLPEINEWKEDIDLVLAFGDPNLLRIVHSRITNSNIKFPNIIDPTFSIRDPQSFEIGQGNIIKPGCYLTVNVSIGNFNVLNGSIGIGHDVSIGNYNVFMPGVKISGEVNIGNGNLFGSGSFIKQQLKVGNNVTLSPLSALLSKPKDNNVYIGNPAKKFNF